MPRAQDPTQSLLRWGIEHAAPGALAQTAQEVKDGKRPDLSTDVLKQIMGTSDADRMRECLQVIEGNWVDREGKGEMKKNEEITDEDKYRAWDDLEMLVEDLDNANDLKSIGGWEPIVKHLSDPDDEIVLRACWVCGTAVQNNPRSLETFLTHNPLPTLLQILTSSNATIETRSKALYCLSSTLKHCEPAVEIFSAPPLNGFEILSSRLLQDPSQKIRTKTVFLLAQLVSQSSKPLELAQKLRENKVIQVVLDSLDEKTAVPTGEAGTGKEIDEDYRSKSLRFFANSVERTEGKGLEPEEKSRLKEILKGLEGGEWNAEEELGMSSEEWEEFKKATEQ
ncbi:Hsp70 nucleotide exchange factor FES1 [Sporobolomyces salmoneus]|uniref:Hsp70 nucleotide exchange factor FES1 n=1 Tax=Sporobolomyces salmoneus TaxID=183962 RepID=UPI0031822C0B